MLSISSFQIALFVLAIIAVGTRVEAAATKKQDPKCLLPMEPGPCRMSLDRFYYNAQTNTCEEFKFGGCRGNDNKFGFKETCEAACKVTASPAASGDSKATNTQPIRKQLSPSTLKSLTDSGPVTEKAQTSTTTTTSTARPKSQESRKH